MVNGKPQLNDIWAVFTNPVFVWGYAKVLFASLVTGLHGHAGGLGVAAAARRGPGRLHPVGAARR